MISSLKTYMMTNTMFMLLFILAMLINVAYLTMFERKFLGIIQLRKGPNKLGFLGLFQPFSDMIKLFSKELFQVSNVHLVYYFLSPMMMTVFSMLLWFLFPFYYNFYTMNYGLVYMFMILSFTVYPLMFGGWSSGSNYAMIGCVRSIAQTISYEVALFLMILSLMMLSEGFSFVSVMKYQVNFNFFMILSPVYLMFLTSMLIELNRTPFDLSEGESELVSGFNVEYFSSNFSLIFMAEYMNIIFVSMITTIFFFYIELVLIIIFLIQMITIIWIRGVMPRMRYDEMMYMCWKTFLTFSLLYLLFIFLFKGIIMYEDM